MKITNVAGGPRGIHTKTGMVLVEPRQTVDVDMADAEKKVALASGWFVEGDAPKTQDETAVDVAGLHATIAERDATIADLTAKLEAATKDDDKSGDRAELKKQATELKIEFANNIPTDKLKVLIDAKLAA